MSGLGSEEINNLFSEAELNRYARHLSLAAIGLEGQQKLKKARVLVVGVGGLGSPVLLYLAAAGVGHLGVLDGDVVDASNLQRQVLYTVQDVGQPKALAAKARLELLNPHIEITAYPFNLSKDNALDLFEKYDIVTDGTDNFATRYLVNDAAVLTGKVNVYGSVSRFEGQVAVFNQLNPDGTRGANYRDLFPTPPGAGAVLNCADEGILGVLPGIIGSMQANEVIKIITGVGEALNGKLALFDAAHLALTIVTIPRTSQVVIKELIDYELFCNAVSISEVNTITPPQLQQWIEEGKDIQLIDVRQLSEHQADNIGGILIPLADIHQFIHLINREKITILYCRSGSRSAAAFHRIKQQGGYCENLFSLEGGIQAWRNWQNKS